MRPGTLDDLRQVLVAAWSLIPQSCIDRLCQGFAARLELCIASEGLSISNQLFQVTDSDAMKSFSIANRVYAPWIPSEDERLLHDYLTID